LGSEYIQFRILYVLYDKFESTGSSQGIQAADILANPELSYVGSIALSTEINYLAKKKFITILSDMPSDANTDWLEINSPGIDTIRFVIKYFPIYLKDVEDQECKDKAKHILAIQNEYGKRVEIYAFIKSHLDYFQEFVDKTQAISLNPIPYNQGKPLGGNTYNVYMSDVFQNIQNSTIINKSSVQNAFNKLESNKENSDALMKIAEFINKSGDIAAGGLFNDFTDELNKQTPEKSRLENIWSGIEKVLPTATSLSTLAIKIMSLFS
jgi:hypothetical protein